ncbi:MAG TPA: 23S rRNA (guanosine(2251)-2'-O)-methyltransferase RlmB [Candidatus Binataceae bacterium]|jgi:23S rRNA (guanosine2251-2'-O)-methyltransferase|nr:23S rRNA (guanosine(2251)-2'-O)-methyltransferase RlmB [Candidatus Binataceae bacterium]
MKAQRGGREERRPRVKPRPHDRQTDRRQIVFGIEPVREMLAADAAAIHTLYVRGRDEARFADEIARVRRAGGAVTMVEDAELARMAGSEARHQGMVAQVRAYRYTDLEELLSARSDPLLVVDGVTDPRNLGAILRSAEGAGLAGVILARDRTADITPAAIKTSAGAWIHLRIAQCGNVAQMLKRLKKMNYWVAALAPEGEAGLYELDVSRPLVVVVGAEGEGLRRLVKEKADFLIKIPMAGRVSSLNVAVATGIVLFEINRHRATIQPGNSS